MYLTEYDKIPIGKARATPVLDHYQDEDEQLELYNEEEDDVQSNGR